MSVELKKKALSTLLEIDDENITDADDITFYADYERYYVLSEQERDSMAWDVLYSEHDDEWYTIHEISNLLNVDVEELKTHLLVKKMLNDNGFSFLNGKILVKGYIFKDLICQYMSFHDFIDRCLKAYKESYDVLDLISEGQELESNGFYIYTELN